MRIGCSGCDSAALSGEMNLSAITANIWPTKMPAMPIRTNQPMSLCCGAPLSCAPAREEEQRAAAHVAERRLQDDRVERWLAGA